MGNPSSKPAYLKNLSIKELVFVLNNWSKKQKPETRFWFQASFSFLPIFNINIVLSAFIFTSGVKVTEYFYLIILIFWCDAFAGEARHLIDLLEFGKTILIDFWKAQTIHKYRQTKTKTF